MIELLFNPRNYFFNLHSIAYFVSGFSIAAEAFFTFFQNKKSILNRSFALATAFIAIWLTGVGMIYCSSVEATALFWTRYSWVGIVFVPPSIYLFSIIWERGNLGKSKKIVWCNFGLAGIFCGASLLTTYIIQGLWSYPWGFYPKAGVGEIVFNLWFYVLMFLSFASFIRSYKHQTLPIRKQQTKFIVVAFTLGFIGSVDFIPNYGIPFYTFGGVFVLSFATMVVYTIVNYKFIEIEAAVHKTIMWIVTSSCVVVPIFFVYRGIYPRVKGAITLEMFFWLATSVGLALYLRLLQPQLGHIFQRRRHSLDTAANQFVKDAIHLKGIAQLVQKVENIISDALGPNHVDIYIYDAHQGKYGLYHAGDDSRNVFVLEKDNPFLQWAMSHERIAYREFIDIDPRYEEIRGKTQSFFEHTGATIVVPVILNEQPLGVITLGEKRNGKRYYASDFHFLSALRSQSAIAISNSMLYDTVEQQVRDRTHELMHTQQQLIQAEKLATVGTLAGGVAHEINNPLTAILTNVQMVLHMHNESNAEVVRDSVELIEEATKRCRSIVKQLMTYAKKPLEASEVSRVDVSDVVKSVMAFISYQLEQESIKVVITGSDVNYWIMGNRNELEQVLTNLMLNGKDAIKRIKKRGQIQVRLSQDKNSVTVVVSDDGEGISDELRHKIFDPFFTTKDVGKGLGLGLSICQSIIEKHNGQIDLQSQPGKGATFTMRLPLAAASSEMRNKV